ncbi:MAG: hypothetical protein D6784_16535, partial [Chloroflexi bacterium]
MNAGEVWRQALGQLQYQVPQATFDTWIKNTYPVRDEPVNGRLTIGVPDRPAREWLENRLYHIIQRTVSGVLGREVDLEFVVAQAERQVVEEEAAPAPPPAVSPGLAVAQADYYSAHFARGGAGFAMVSHYERMFWMPYLGKAYDLYTLLANHNRDSVKKVEHRWTEPERFSYRKLQKQLNYTHTRVISGFIYECPHSRRWIETTGEQIPDNECCRLAGARVRVDRENRRRCVYWRPGLLEQLYAEGLVAVEEVKSPSRRAIRAHVLKIQTWRLLPVLTPAQVSTLNVDLQDEHSRWVRDFGQLVGLESVSHWEQITEQTLVPLMEGYREYRQLHGPYQPDSQFLQLPYRFCDTVSQLGAECDTVSQLGAECDTVSQLGAECDTVSQ